jgi:DNA repair protein RadC
MTEKSQFWQDLKTGKFASMVKETSKGKYLSNPQEAYNVIKPIISEDDDIEKMYAIYLNSKNQIISIEKMFSGSIQSATIYPREIIKRTIHHKASSFILAHNHPSGDTEPSTEDISITTKIGIAAASIDVTLHDHIIIGDGYKSLSESGWIKRISGELQKIIQKPNQQGLPNTQKKEFLKGDPEI